MLCEVKCPTNPKLGMKGSSMAYASNGLKRVLILFTKKWVGLKENERLRKK